MSAIATQLGASPRTLQRRLADAETTFQEVVDTVRRRYAERYLADDRLAIAEVGIRVAVWKGLDLRLGVAALVAPGEKVRVNPTPGIGWSFQF